jgi:hypothetical protein
MERPDIRVLYKVIYRKGQEFVFLLDEDQNFGSLQHLQKIKPKR